MQLPVSAAGVALHHETSELATVQIVAFVDLTVVSMGVDEMLGELPMQVQCLYLFIIKEVISVDSVTIVSELPEGL